MSHVYDVVIVGAGPAGAAAAHYLAASGHDVLLLDKATFPRDKTCGDGLTPRAVRVLDDMGLLPQLLAAGGRLSEVRIVAPHGRFVDSAMPQRAGWPDYTLVVPRLILDDVVRQRAIASGAAFESPVEVTDLAADQDGITVQGVTRGRAVAWRGRMAVLATGASLKLLKRLGILKSMPPVALSSRAYFEDMRALPDAMYLSFAGLPLPGYGWVFPLSHTSANIGAGVVPPRVPWRRSTIRSPFETFINTPQLQTMLQGARRVGPVKGYPIRTDFVRAPTWSTRTLLVGEAAGLVNPLTAEGIDYALESGRLAAEHLGRMFRADDFSTAQHHAYDTMLRDHFEQLFRFCERVLWLCHSGTLLDLAVGAASANASLKARLVDVVLGGEAAPVRLSPATLLRVMNAMGTAAVGAGRKA